MKSCTIFETEYKILMLINMEKVLGKIIDADVHLDSKGVMTFEVNFSVLGGSYTKSRVVLFSMHSGYESLINEMETLLRNAKCESLRELTNKPVEISISAQEQITDYRILTEVL